uniref:Uncharacterized protein n=1 Tax=Arundo donax TaxID=35708 RepID=A0A0A9BE29_ARUDO
MQYCSCCSFCFFVYKFSYRFHMVILFVFCSCFLCFCTWLVELSFT